MQLTPEEIALLDRIMGGGFTQLQMPRPGRGVLYPQPEALPPQPIMPSRMPLPEPGAMTPGPIPGNIRMADVRNANPPPPVVPRGNPFPSNPVPPLAAIVPEQTDPNASRFGKIPMPAEFAGRSIGLGPDGFYDRDQMAAGSAVATNDAPPAQAGGFLSGLFGDGERAERVRDMFLGWAMGAGGTWQDSLAMGAKNVAIGKTTRKEEQKAAGSLNATQELARTKGVPEDVIAAFGQDGKGLLKYVTEAGKASYRTITDPAERASLGIPETDKAVYQVDADGKINRVGEGGVKLTINDEIDQRRRAAAELGLDPNSPQGQSFILTGRLPREDQQPLTATDKKAILEADEMVSAAQGALPLINRALELNSAAYSGPAAGVRGTVGSWLGMEGAEETVELNNVVTEQALSQMKAIFGGNPTEGERAILLDIAGSADMPPEVRRKVFERAKAAVERRLQLYKERADQLRGGTFYTGQGTPPAPPAAAVPGQTTRRRYNPQTGELE